METHPNSKANGQRTQVGPDPLDYVLRYDACDYDCYHQGRYIGSRPTLAKAIEVVEYEQAKARFHTRSLPDASASIASCRDELRAIAARLHDLSDRLANHPAKQTPSSAQLTMAHIRISQAIKNLQDAERSCALAERSAQFTVPLDATA